MKKELDDKLVQKFPKIFADRYVSPRESPMAWGFGINDGWFNLIYSLCKCVQRYLDQKPEIEQVVAAQVKEKFGTLCFYYDGGDEYIRGLVTMTQYLSGCTCEICGNPGKFINDGWMKVRCEKCL